MPKLEDLAAAAREPGRTTRSARKLNRTVLVEQTSKILKLHMLMGFTVCLIATIGFFGTLALAASRDKPLNGTALALCGFVFAVGFLWVAGAKAVAWWRHG